MQKAKDTTIPDSLF